MKSQNIYFAFYVSGGASRLQKLIEINSQIIQNTILVISDNAPQVKLQKLLTNKGINYIEVNYKELNLTSSEKNTYISNLMLQEFKKYNVEYCFCFGSRILNGNLLNEYKNRIINFHPAILPMFPGQKSIDQAINKNAFLLGNTAHFIDKGVDTGPIIMQSIIHSNNYLKYEDILGQQITMIEQIHRWIISKRLVISKNKVTIESANYSSIAYYPKIELK